MKKNPEYCLSCGKKSVREVRRTIRVEYDILLHVYLKHIRVMECKLCGHRRFTSSQRKEQTRAFNARMRAHFGLLPPSEWTRIRRILGLSRTLFEQTIGLAPSRASQIELDLVIPTLTEDLLARLVLQDVGTRKLRSTALATRAKEKKEARKKPREH